jgi:hypothetical protein
MLSNSQPGLLSGFCARGQFLKLYTLLLISKSGGKKRRVHLVLFVHHQHALATSMLVRQRNGGGKHTARVETTFQRPQPSAVAAIGVSGLFSIIWRQQIRVAAG